MDKRMILHENAIAFLKEMIREEENRKGACPRFITSGVEKGSLSEREVDVMVRLLNFRREFLETGDGKPFLEGALVNGLCLSLNAGYFRDNVMQLPGLMGAFAHELAVLTNDEDNLDAKDIKRLADSLEEQLANIPGFTSESETCRVTQVTLLQYMELVVKMLSAAVGLLNDVIAGEEGGEGDVTDGTEQYLTITLTPPKGPLN